MASSRPVNTSHSTKPAPKDTKNIICFKFGEPGHKSPNCPKGKDMKDESANAANGNNTKKTRSAKNSHPRKTDIAQPALVCSAQAFNLPDPIPTDNPVLTWHNIVFKEDRKQKATEKYVTPNVYDVDEYREYMNVFDRLISIHFDVYTNLDITSNGVTTSFLPFIHDHHMEEDLISLRIW
jgi:hypothetical protein